MAPADNSSSGPIRGRPSKDNLYRGDLAFHNIELARLLAHQAGMCGSAVALYLGETEPDWNRIADAARGCIAGVEDGVMHLSLLAPITDEPGLAMQSQWAVRWSTSLHSLGGRVKPLLTCANENDAFRSILEKSDEIRTSNAIEVGERADSIMPLMYELDSLSERLELDLVHGSVGGDAENETAQAGPAPKITGYTTAELREHLDALDIGISSETFRKILLVSVLPGNPTGAAGHLRTFRNSDINKLADAAERGGLIDDKGWRPRDGKRIAAAWRELAAANSANA